nr:ABC transporter ATP-binding protein [Halorhabdus salina]
MSTDYDDTSTDDDVEMTVTSLDAHDPIMQIHDARVTYDMDRGESRVLDDVHLELEREEIIGVVGESGSGKSMLASAMLDSVPDPGQLAGQIRYNPEDRDQIDLLSLSKEELRQVRWEDISMVFQGAMSSFNPVLSVKAHFKETLETHDHNVKEGMERARELLSDLYLQPDRVLNSYPHELSGGMRQRALLALSVVLEPDVLVMDEPTAALDLLMQRSILMLMEELQESYDLTMLFITHDLPLVASLADRMAIMYAFQLVEIGPTRALLDKAAHPYTRALLNSTPNLDAPLDEMQSIEGASPDPVNVPDGCSYHPRCPFAEEKCIESEPEYFLPETDHGVACFNWREAKERMSLNHLQARDDSGEQVRDTDDERGGEN